MFLNIALCETITGNRRARDFLLAKNLDLLLLSRPHHLLSR